MTVEQLTTEQRLDQLSEQIAFLVEEQKLQRDTRESLGELIRDLGPLARQTMDSAAVALVEAEQRGYMGFAREGLEVVDKVVTSFSEEDVKALGDNVVLILETVKEMTQPELMQMMRTTIHEVGEMDDSGEPPGMMNLLRQMRDPDVRRGLARMMTLLRSMGSADPNVKGDRKEARP